MSNYFFACNSVQTQFCILYRINLNNTVDINGPCVWVTSTEDKGASGVNSVRNVVTVFVAGAKSSVSSSMRNGFENSENRINGQKIHI